jgi:predicted transcriptional regulator
MTLRLDAERAAELEAIAQINHKSVSETVREAIDEMIERVRKDNDFQKRLKDSMTRNQRVLKRLAG